MVLITNLDPQDWKKTRKKWWWLVGLIPQPINRLMVPLLSVRRVMVSHLEMFENFDVKWGGVTG